MLQQYSSFKANLRHGNHWHSRQHTGNCSRWEPPISATLSRVPPCRHLVGTTDITRRSTDYVLFHHHPSPHMSKDMMLVDSVNILKTIITLTNRINRYDTLVPAMADNNSLNGYCPLYQYNLL